MAGGEVLTEEKVFVGGPEKRPIVIAAYRPEWVARFAFERDRIVAALGPRAVRVEHVGSTSVPGLGAKPIVDILVAVADIADDGGFVPALVVAGYVVRVRERGEHWMLRTPEQDVHVHLCSAGGDWEHRHLLFRDWLRHDGADRAAYEAAKRALALVDWPSTQHYSAAKSTIIGEITARARPWAAATGWTVPPPRA
ncbi:GrpB family protein [Pseudofrankia sp. DC12]|uniref:GrpB family protein n=1 Tax=Pseudofrankia sp. DC12 TaxID=683315 RepID=UPI0005F827AC|nr:GrpB family protein [Pseudofrankia sp. DC12]